VKGYEHEDKETRWT